MSLTIEKFIDRGLNPGQVSAKSFQVGFTPVNFAPTAVNGEGTDKISAFFKGVDNTIGGLANGGIVRESFTSTENQTDFFPVASFTTEMVVEVLINGRLQKEIVAYDRNSTLNRIQLVEGIPAGHWVEIRVYTKDPIEENFTATSDQTVFNLVADINSETKMFVSVGGRLQRETGVSPAFSRDIVNNRLTFSEGLPSGYWVHVLIL